MHLKGPLSFILAFCAFQALALDFSQSKWIWTNEGNPPVNEPISSRAFRRDFTTPQGKQAVAANINIVADNEYTLYVNGLAVGNGQAYENNFPNQAQAYQCLPLQSTSNVFAVNGTNQLGASVTTPNPAAMLAAIQIIYSDSTSQTIVSDASWLFSLTFPAGWQQATFSDSAWTAVQVGGAYGIGPWGAVTPPVASNIAPSLTDANWIWTNEIWVPGAIAPIGSRAFRKTITLPLGTVATSATISISVDDEYQLFVNGELIGSATNFGLVQEYVVNFSGGVSEVSIAVMATNVELQAGVLAAVQLAVLGSNCGTTVSFVTDGSWKYSLTVPADFQLPSFDDSAWPLAFNQVPYGAAPWNDILGLLS